MSKSMQKVTEEKLRRVIDLIDINPKDAKAELIHIIGNSNTERFTKQLFKKSKPKVIKISLSSILFGIAMGILISWFLIHW